MPTVNREPTLSTRDKKGVRGESYSFATGSLYTSLRGVGQGTAAKPIASTKNPKNVVLQHPIDPPDDSGSQGGIAPKGTWPAPGIDVR